MATDGPETTVETFAVLCQPKEGGAPLYLRELTFARLLDDVVHPYETGEAFFVDGVSLTKAQTHRLKIVRESSFFSGEFASISREMRVRKGAELKAAADTYDRRLSALFLEATEDVPSQVLKAFNSEVKPKLKDYVPNRAELISAASKVFTEAIRALAT